MARHMFFTVLIVFSVYVGMLFVIDHPFVAQAAESVPGAQNKASDGQADNTDQFEVSTADVEVRAVTVSPKALFKGPTIAGIETRVDLSNGADDVELVWEKLLANKPLVNNVDWSKGSIKAYAYYRDFDANFASATLSIGFDVEDLKLHSDQSMTLLPSGQFDRFNIDLRSGYPPEQAWLKAYEHKNLIERHTLNRDGETVAADAIVVWK